MIYLIIFIISVIYLFLGIITWGVRTNKYNDPIKAIPYGIFWIILFVKFIYRGFKSVLAD